MSLELYLHRTFHPAGQGAFYTEVFECDGNYPFVAVYDCGTETSNIDFTQIGGKLLSTQIGCVSSSLKAAGKNNLDLLFVSHLHEDHVSGIKELIRELPPDSIVLPMLPIDVIYLAIIDNLVRFGASAADTAELIQDLYFGKREGITGVRPAKEDESSGALYPLHPTKTIKSGEPIYFGEELFWRYRPFNSIDSVDPRVKVLIDKVKSIPGVFNEIAINLTKALEHLKELTAAYEKVIGSARHNIYTLVVESEPVDGVKEMEKYNLAHCVYFGDFEPNDDMWTRFLTTINDFDQVGTIQVPHHGSRLNWRKGMLTPRSKLCVISSGINNRHHHPNYWVTEVISLAGVEVKVVSERPGSSVQSDIRVK